MNLFFSSDRDEKIWQEYCKNVHSEIFDLESYVDIATKLYPEMAYLDCCRSALLFVGNRGWDVPFSPHEYILICKEIITRTNPSTILVPFADGSELCFLNKDNRVEYHFENKQFEFLAKENYSIKTINSITDIAPEKKYDLILADLPFASVTNKNNPSKSIVEKCSIHLSETGYAVFTFKKDITGIQGQKWFQKLANQGLYCNAILDMSMYSYGWFSSDDAVIAIFSKQLSKQLFVAQLKSYSNTPIVINNFLNKSCQSKHPEQGVYVDKNIYSYSEYDIQKRIKEKTDAISKAYKGRICKILEIGMVCEPDSNHVFTEKANSIYIPIFGDYPVVTCIEEFKVKASFYLQVVLNEELITASYLEFFLNSEDGYDLRQLYLETSGGGLSKFIIENIEIPCPDKSYQSEYLKTKNQLEDLLNEVKELEYQFYEKPYLYETIRENIMDINNHGDRFVQWIETLPYPLATILHRYIAADDYRTKHDLLSFFFEAYSIFESTILIAALDTSIINCSALKDVNLEQFKESSFGGWVKISECLSADFRKMLKSNDVSRRLLLSCFKTDDKKLVEYICNAQTVDVLRDAEKLRNKWRGHGGLTDTNICIELTGKYNSYLAELIKNIRSLYNRLRLIRPTVITSCENDQYAYKADILTGANPIFVPDSVSSPVQLKPGKLYIQMKDTNEILPLPPTILLKEVAGNKNVCYFYNRLNDNKTDTDYISYHFESEPYTEPGHEAYETIINLLHKQ